MSSKRSEIIASGEIYHVFNQSVGKEEIFLKNRDLERASVLLEYYKFPQKLRYSFFKRLKENLKQEYLSKYKALSPVVEIYAFAFMSNHFHLLLKQKIEKGIEKFVSNFQNSFAKYYNTKHQRVGSLFRNSFKAKRLASDWEFLHVSRYIHLQPVTSFLIEYSELEKFRWTSYPHYIVKKDKDDFIDTNLIVKLAGSTQKYIKFVENQVDYQRQLHLIKHVVLE